jgi:hypothetical protein
MDSLMNTYKRIYIREDKFYCKTLYFDCENKYITDKVYSFHYDVLNNEWGRILLISGLDYKKKGYITFDTFEVYMKNIKDFDRYIEVLCTIYNIKLQSVTYKRIRIESFFYEYK